MRNELQSNRIIKINATQWKWMGNNQSIKNQGINKINKINKINNSKIPMKQYKINNNQ